SCSAPAGSLHGPLQIFPCACRQQVYQAQAPHPSDRLLKSAGAQQALYVSFARPLPAPNFLPPSPISHGIVRPLRPHHTARAFQPIPSLFSTVLRWHPSVLRNLQMPSPSARASPPSIPQNNPAFFAA